MKFLKPTSATLVLSTLAFGVFAAQEITREEAEKNHYTKVTTVNITASASSPMDAHEQLSRLADESGGKYYVIIAGAEKGRISAIADVYK